MTVATFEFIRQLPKAELHIHIEGSLQPAHMLALAQKHGVMLPYANLAELEAAYQFDNLQSFLDLYYQGAAVLTDEEDFYELMWCYLCRCREENIVHAEIMFDPQTHTSRGLPFAEVIGGLRRAMAAAEREWGQSSALILCFLRHLSEDAAFATLQAALPYRDSIVAVGLDSSEIGHPPAKFQRVFQRAIEEGFLCVAHAGEEGPAQYIRDAMSLLHVQRIDHGVRCVDDLELVRLLREMRLPLTVCPLSNIRLCVFDDMSAHPVLQLLEEGLCVTVNSDDPAYFGGYLNDNFCALATSLEMTQTQAVRLARNSFEASFLCQREKQKYLSLPSIISSD